MPSTIIVNFMTTQHKSSVGVTAGFPDVCKTPAPPAPAPIPIPYPNVGSSSMASDKVTKRVGDNKQKVMIKGAAYTMTSGDEPGVAMGIVSSKIKGKSKIMNQSFDVKFEGKGVGRLTDPHGNNTGGSPNVPVIAEVQSPMVGMPPKTPEQEKACKELEKTKVKKKDRKKVAEENGMDGDHAEAISGYCEKSGNSATFRSGNASQVPHINGKGPHCKDGVPLPGKPMSVKNKSINLGKRPDSVKWPDGKVDTDLTKKIADNKLEGLVGVYDKHGKLRGVKTTTGARSLDKIPPVPGNTWAGDYDGHDFFGKDGKRITGDQQRKGYDRWFE